MTNTKNAVPLYAEEQIIQQKIKISSNFIELKTVGKNYICSTQGWPKEPLCEQYRFSVNGKLIQLDIPHELMEKLGLELGKEITYPLYISPSVLKQKPDEFGGITINNEKDIICQKEGTILVQEKQTQIDFTSGEITDLKQKLKKSEKLSQETQNLLEKVLKNNEEKHITIIFFEQQIRDLTQRITELRRDLEQGTLDKRREENKCKELERKIRKLKEDEQVLIGLQTRISDVQNELAGERLIREKAEQDLQTRTEERDARPNITQGQYGNDVLKYRRQISSLEREIKRLDDIIKLLEELAEGELNENQTAIADLNNQINQLTTQKNNLQTQVNDLNQQLTTANNDRNKLSSEINDLKNQLHSAQNEKNKYYNQVQDSNRQLSSWRDDYYKKDREVDNLSRQLSNERSDNGSLRSRINSLEDDLREERRGNIKELFVLGENSYDNRPSFEVHGVHVEGGTKYKIDDEWGSAYFGDTVKRADGWVMGDGSSMGGVVRARFKYKKVLARVIRELSNSAGVEHEWCFPHEGSNYCNYNKKYL